MRISVVFHLLLLALTSCNLFNKSTEPQLPPATQEGKNTFGCLVNGKVWLPSGNNGTANPDATYDESTAGGALGIEAYRIDGADLNNIFVYTTNMSSTGEYDLGDPVVGSVLFYLSDECYFDKDSGITRVGVLHVTKFSIAEQIVSGTFEITLVKPNCDTLKITQGRFDMKF